ncbi:MAG: Sarcosine dehydrogenase, partial [Ilumatobacteraceae bacterium]|nr:Sarcosine dehydrogenase [Ilumatobacteraceae bacterium]
RDADVAAQSDGPLTRRIVQVQLCDPGPLLFHAEVVHRNGRPVGYIRSASYGFTLGGAVGLAMVDAGEPLDAAPLCDAEWTVDVAGRHVPAIASSRPLYDPSNVRIRQ